MISCCWFVVVDVVVVVAVVYVGVVELFSWEED